MGGGVPGSGAPMGGTAESPRTTQDQGVGDMREVGWGWDRATGEEQGFKQHHGLRI